TNFACVKTNIWPSYLFQETSKCRAEKSRSRLCGWRLPFSFSSCSSRQYRRLRRRAREPAGPPAQRMRSVTAQTVPAGEIMMGSPPSERGRNSDEGPQRKVTFAQPFATGKYVVTFAQWDACVAAGGCTHRPGDNDWGRGKRPVINVSWNDAEQFVGWLAKKTGKPYRLLTEAEWEYAARGSTKAIDRQPPFSTGLTINPNQANYDGNFSYGAGGKTGIYRQKTLEVGSFKPNAFGLYDMH